MVNGIKPASEGPKDGFGYSGAFNLKTLTRKDSEAGFKLVLLDPKGWDSLETPIMALETACYHPNIQFERDYKKEEMTKKGAVALLVMKDGKVIGEVYGSPLSTMKDELDADNKELRAFEELFERFRGKEGKVFYCMGISVLPEYQGRGIGTKLEEELVRMVKAAGYESFVLHAHEGPSEKIAKRLGAGFVKTYQNWYDTGDTYYLLEKTL